MAEFTLPLNSIVKNGRYFKCENADNKNIRIFEVPITINSRGVNEGKKVKWWHFFTYIFSIIKWRFKD